VFFLGAEAHEDLDIWTKEYNEQRPHSGKYCFGKTPMQTFIDSIQSAKEKCQAVPYRQTNKHKAMFVRLSNDYYILINQ
jgi:hypothetical protein